MTDEPSVPSPTRDVDRLLTTTRSVRRRLDIDRPVADALLRECLAIALQAPNASNRQGWRWIIVTEHELRRQVGAIYRRAYVDIKGRRDGEAASAHDGRGRIDRSVLWLVDHFAEVPVFVVACTASPLQTAATRSFDASTLYGSVYPAIWSLQLALASRGVGSCPTTLLLRREAELRAALEIPDSHVPVCALVAAHLKDGPPFKPAPRRPLDEVAAWNRWPG